MTKTEEALSAMWRGARNQPAWLSRLVEQHALDAQDEAFLNDTDDAFVRAVKTMEGEWRRDAGNRLRQFRAEVDEEWAKGRRREYLGEAIRKLEREISALCGETPDEGTRDDLTRMFNRLRVQDLEHQKGRLAWELRSLSRRGKRNGLEPFQIEKARAFPMEELVETKRGMMLCPLHEDTHPSMLVKKGFGYCFSCGGHLDSIGYLMNVRGMRFREAVEALQ